MAATRETASSLGISRQQYLVLGIVASAGALLVNPVITAVSPLYFVGGLIVSVVVPGVSGLVALASGIQLYRLRETRRGITLVVGSLLTTVIGVFYGLSTVF